MTINAGFNSRPVVRIVPLLVLAVNLGCGTPAPRRLAPDYEQPWNIMVAEYSVPVAIGLASPGTVGGWREGPTLNRFVQGWTHRPSREDMDNDFVNLVLHPLAGSETHMLARRYGWTFGEAVLFDFAGSLLWEYVFENLVERPSRIDLMVTAPVGLLLGELRYQARDAGILP